HRRPPLARHRRSHPDLVHAEWPGAVDASLWLDRGLDGGHGGPHRRQRPRRYPVAEHHDRRRQRLALRPAGPPDLRPAPATLRLRVWRTPTTTSRRGGNTVAARIAV